MDVDMYMWATASNRNNPQDMIAFHRAAGSRLSAMEHIVPEEVFKDETNPENSPKGISAVKVLNIAAQQGQKIFTLTKANQSQLQFVNAETAIKQEIAQALKQGKEVTIHENPITAYGWSGSGYLIIDPHNGTGAYKIGGGTNGAILAMFGGALMILIGMYLGGLLLVPFLAGLLFGFGVAGLIGGFTVYLAEGNEIDINALLFAMAALKIVRALGEKAGLLATGILWEIVSVVPGDTYTE